jgi:hypothetical protein
VVEQKEKEKEKLSRPSSKGLLLSSTHLRHFVYTYAAMVAPLTLWQFASCEHKVDKYPCVFVL